MNIINRVTAVYSETVMIYGMSNLGCEKYDQFLYFWSVTLFSVTTSSHQTVE